MSIFKRGRIWWYEFKFENTRIRESSHGTDEEACKRMEKKRWAALQEGRQGLAKPTRHKEFGGLGGGKPNVPAGAAQAFIESQETHWAPKTVAMHLNSLRHLQSFFGRLLLNDIKEDHISRFQRQRRKEGASNRSINIEISLVRLVLRKAKLWNNISDDVKPLKERADIGRELSADETQRLLAACQASASRGLYPAVLTSIHTGLRSQELRLLRWRQVDLVEGTITVGKSKTEGGEGRLVYLSEMAKLTLEHWRCQFSEVQPEHCVFPSERYALKGKKGTFGGTVTAYKTFPGRPITSFAKSWRTAKKAAKVEVRWHDLRHCAASRIAAGGATDQTLQALLGWMSPKMIERYSHVRAEAKRRAVQVFDEPERGESPQKSPQSQPGGRDTIN